MGLVSGGSAGCLCVSRSSPGETRESQAVECEKLGKRVRKKRKIYMDSGDEEEDNNQEEEEVSRKNVVQLHAIAAGHHVKCSVFIICFYCLHSLGDLLLDGKTEILWCSSNRNMIE